MVEILFQGHFSICTEFICKIQFDQGHWAEVDDGTVCNKSDIEVIHTFHPFSRRN